MDFRTATSRKLDEEHRDSLALLGRFERGVLGVAVGSAPDDGFALLAKQVARAVAGEVDRHFRFEEEQLFPRLAAGGEGDLADLLLDEHKSIRATAADLLPPLLAASTGRLDAAQFAALKPVALEFVEFFLRDALAGEFAEAGVDAVDGLVFRQDGLDDLA